MLVLLSPGQGSQTPGMLLPWLDLPGVESRLATWSEAAGLDLMWFGTAAPAEEIRDTAVAQPLLTAAALLSAEALVAAGTTPDAVCGHSVGELSALAVAGALPAVDAVRLAAGRGAAMAQAAAERPTGMSAVLGGDPEQVEAALAAHGLAVATVNVAGQCVAGGPVEGLAALAAAPPAGARVRPLDVAGAFHTAAMAPAAPALRRLLDATPLSAPRCPVVANGDGTVVADPQELASRLVAQLTAPVRFDLCLQRLAALGATAVVELAPGGTLAALVKRALPGVPVLAVKGPQDLAAAAELAASREPVTA